MDFEHLKILNQGETIWNKWRKSDDNIRPDLRGVELQGRELSGYNFDACQFYRANLQGANLSGASFRSASLSKSILIQTDFTGAMIKYAKFVYSDLTGANFSNTDLFHSSFAECTMPGSLFTSSRLVNTIFNACYLDASSFERSIMKDTVFSNTILDNVFGLDSIDFQGTINVDIRTYQSDVNFPDEFMSRAGLNRVDSELPPTQFTLNFDPDYSWIIGLIDYPLKRTIKDRFIADYSGDRITLYFDSNEDLQAAINLIVPALAGIYSDNHNTIRSAEFTKEDRSKTTISAEELRQELASYRHFMIEELPKLIKTDPEYSDYEKLAIATAESLPVAGPISKFIMEKHISTIHSKHGPDPNPSFLSEVFNLFDNLVRNAGKIMKL